MNCQNCHKEIAEYSNFCYYCGARQNERAQRRPASTEAPDAFFHRL